MVDDRLVILSEYFYPESSATSQLLTQLATGLTDRFDVSCITSFPNYHSGDRGRTVPRNGHHDGVDITRVRSTQFDKDELPKRVLNWLTYTVAATVRLLRSPSDIVLVVSNPPTLPAAAWLRKRVLGTPYVYLIHDLYPDIAVALGLVNADSMIERVWQRTNSYFFKNADRIVVLGESMREQLLSRYDAVDKSQVVVIHNWEDESFIEPVPKSENSFAHEHGTVDPFTIVYSGNIGRFHELKTAIDAVDRLDDQGYNLKLLIIGEGAQKSELQDYVARNAIDTVEFLPFQPTQRLPASLTCGDISLVGIKEGMQGLCVSSKLYSSLAAGRPILAVVGDGDEVEAIVEECNAGLHVEPNDVKGCAENIKRWIETPGLTERQGRNARSCFERRFTFEVARGRYRATLHEVVTD